MAGEVEREVVEAVADDAAAPPVGVDLRVVGAAPGEEVPPAQQDAQVTQHLRVNHLQRKDNSRLGVVFGKRNLHCFRVTQSAVLGIVRLKNLVVSS